MSDQSDKEHLTPEERKREKNKEEILNVLDPLFGARRLIADKDFIMQQMAENPPWLDPMYRADLKRVRAAKQANDPHYSQFATIFPFISTMLDAYIALLDKELAWEEKGAKDKLGDKFGDNPETNDYILSQFMSVFGEPGTKGFVYSKDALTTQTNISRIFNDQFKRADNPPSPVMPWEMRIGCARFSVPPINVKVSQTFQVGSLSGGVIRQQSAPKFNSGHSETVVSMTLYFPTHESIFGLWGKDLTEGAGSKTINFDDTATDDEEIDHFLSSLRGLITQFKYAPFLPIRNAYLNQAWGITGVTLQSMNISTVENYPFCVAVNLQMLKFNHKVYLPMIEDFHQAIHWGRFRQYMGRAAMKIQEEADKGFWVERPQDPNDPSAPAKIDWESLPTNQFSSPGGGRSVWGESAPNIEFYYPRKTPGRIFAPDDSMFRQVGEDIMATQPVAEAFWETFLTWMGINHDRNPSASYTAVRSWSQQVSPGGQSDTALIIEYLKNMTITTQEMTEEHKKRFIDGVIKQSIDNNQLVDPNKSGLTPEQKADAESNIQAVRERLENQWYAFMWTNFQDTPFFQNYKNNYEYKNGQFTIQEWEVPMDKMAFDPASIFIQGITVSLSNNFAKLQLQMHEDPVHQHIGGGESTVEISAIILGEENLVRMRRMFQQIGGLARLEHAHGVLGFLGVKNVLTQLASIKYILPSTFEVDTIPGYPRVYTVRMGFVDFDVFQQKREKLSSQQQQEFVKHFGKRNPFLRLKQMWNAFNAYPDFPLTLKDPEDNNTVVGTLDPDFYFRQFNVIDDDVVYWSNPIDSPEPNATATVNPNGSVTPSPDSPSQAEDANTVEPSAQELGQLGASANFYSGYDFSDISSAALTDRQKTQFDMRIQHSLGVSGSAQNQAQLVEISSGGLLRFGTYDSTTKQQKWAGADKGKGITYNLLDDHPSYATQLPAIYGLTPFSSYNHPYANNTSSPFNQFQLMMRDMQYRNVGGRMVRAFPTYMLWLIDEGGRFGGVKLFDNFYGLQSVVDFSVHSSEDILGDTLVLRVSNLYSKLTTPYKGYLLSSDGYPGAVSQTDQATDWQAALINRGIIIDQNLRSGLGDYVQELDSIRLKPGVRVHLRMGYSANPNALQTVFNGTITEVKAGEIVEITAQSDAIELSPYVNTSNKKGHSGEIDGALNTGFWMSEPRDLMVRLLSMGSSTFKEAFAHATQGMIFSENRFGIRHFGQILYEPINQLEQQKQGLRYEVVTNAINNFAGAESATQALGAAGNMVVDPKLSSNGNDGINPLIGGGFDAMLGGASVRSPMLALVQSMWTNFFRKRDYELFKRNIYPGNGLGVAQYLAGDLMEGGGALAEAAGVLGPEAQTGQGAIESIVGSNIDTQFRRIAETQADVNGGRVIDPKPANQANQDPATVSPQAGTGVAGAEMSALTMLASPSTGGLTVATELVSHAGQFFDIAKGLLNMGSYKNHPLLQMMGLAGNDDDLKGFDEVSFRAQTYMKSVWDLFQMCAALLPNYIVSVRPFEDRSTVFYGKPHWLYTSGVIPLTMGIPVDNEKIKFEGPDAAMREEQKKIANIANPLADLADAQKFFKAINSNSVAQALAGGTGTAAVPGAPNVPPVDQLPLVDGNGATIPLRRGQITRGLHVPTRANMGVTKGAPGFPDRPNVPRQGDGHLERGDLPAGKNWPHYASMTGWDDSNKYEITPQEAEQLLMMGPDQLMDPRDEQYYIMMRWPYQDWGEEGNPYKPGLTKDAYKYKKVLVFAERSQRAIICAINPNPGPPVGSGYSAALSPDAMVALDIAGGDYCHFGFYPDDGAIPGPTDNSASIAEFKNSQEAAAPEAAQATDNRPNILSNDGLDYYNMTQSDPKFMRVHKTDSSGRDTGQDLNDNYSIDNTDWWRNYTAYSYEFGWFDTNVKAWENPGLNDDGTSLVVGTTAHGYNVDIVGELARRMYDKHYNHFRFDGKISIDGEVKELKDSSQVKNYKNDHHCSDDEAISAIFGDTKSDTVMAGEAAAKTVFESFETIRKGFKDAAGQTFEGITLHQANVIWDQFRESWFIHKTRYTEVRGLARLFLQKAGYWKTNENGDVVIDDSLRRSDNAEHFWYDGDRNQDDAKDNPELQMLFSTNMSLIVNNFKRVFWEIPYARAWLAITTDRHYVNMYLTDAEADQYDFASSPVSDAFEWFLFGDFPPSKEEIANAIEKGGQWTEKNQSDNGSKYQPNVTHLLHFTDKTSLSPGDLAKKAASGQADAYDVYANKGDIEAFIAYLQAHQEAGNKGDVLMDLKKAFDNSIGALVNMVASSLTGIVGMFRLSLMELGHGLNMLGSMQAQANILNRVFNDSIYYSVGTPGSLVWAADNPFTREYGEPVVEIREPFQRLHFLNSFNDILSNGITETISGVPTVITATSDGKYPVTVYFDRGAPSERQVESAVETGLFWDNARGSGFFGFLHPFLHPIETLRANLKSMGGTSDEVLSKRIALWHLKEGLKNIYMGEMLVLGNADIRPHDLVYLADVYERMYGMFEVEAVTHHFTPETGFVTAITPNAIVTINDPARWSMISWVWGMMGIQDTRSHVKSLLNVVADKSSEIYTQGTAAEITTGPDGSLSLPDLAKAIEIPLISQTQYTGGSSALGRDMASSAAGGFMRASDGLNAYAKGEKVMSLPNQLLNSPISSGLSLIPGVSMVQDMAWDGWTWIRDNLLDQHGCYIQYLVKDGQPMDAGLSYNQGVAVGRHHSINALPGILGLNVDSIVDGHTRITANDLLASLGWTEREINGIQRQASWWADTVNAKVLQSAGSGPDPFALMDPEVMLVKVMEVGLDRGNNSGIIDGDTFWGYLIDTNTPDVSGTPGPVIKIRLSGINTPELRFKDETQFNDPYDKAWQAREFLEQRLINDAKDGGYEPTVAIRINPNNQYDTYGRTLATVFHNIPAGTPKANREETLKEMAGWQNPVLKAKSIANPIIPWDSFMPDGRAYTANWELVLAGLAVVDLGGVTSYDRNRGVVSGQFTGG